MLRNPLVILRRARRADQLLQFSLAQGLSRGQRCPPLRARPDFV
jgi:hypothetical protein